MEEEFANRVVVRENLGDGARTQVVGWRRERLESTQGATCHQGMVGGEGPEMMPPRGRTRLGEEGGDGGGFKGEEGEGQEDRC